ncbi:hypothetical protein C0992_009910 [Termitomyces sp. T32_za158]|nr:hypothetical protein C0992_009910 [Termitomyces sp. T32_za158]
MRPNLHVLLHNRVTRLLETPSSTKLATPLIRTVEFADENTRGDAGDLTALGINPIVNLPDVGKNLSDQAALVISWSVNSNDTLDNVNNNATLRAELLEEWKEDKSGPFVGSGSTHVAWLRVPPNSSIFDVTGDPSSGENSPHYELFTVDGGFGAPTGTGHFISIGIIVVSPASRGTISLHSSDPFDPPIIDPRYLTSEFDIFAMREAVQSARRFIAAPAWNDYVIGPVGAIANATTDELLDIFIRQNAGSPAHPVGTAAMSAKNATFGVVDPDLQAKGIMGLRIVDASVMPFITAGHTQAPVYIIAERAADLIKEKWNLQ